MITLLGGGLAPYLFSLMLSFRKVYHISIYCMEISILKIFFCFYPDLQQLYSVTIFIAVYIDSYVTMSSDLYGTCSTVSTGQDLVTVLKGQKVVLII